MDDNFANFSIYDKKNKYYLSWKYMYGDNQQNLLL